MKSLKKIALALGGLSAVCAGFAVGTVASTQKAAEPVKAATTDSVVLRGLFHSCNFWSADYKTFTYNAKTSRFELTVYLAKDDEFKVVDTTASKWAGYHSDLGSSVVSGTDGSNLKALASGTYTISVNDFSNYGDASYIFQSSSGSITFENTGSPDYSISGYLFLSGCGYSSPCVYTFKGHSNFGSFPGTSLSNFLVSDVTFDGAALYRLPIYSDFNDTGLIIDNGLAADATGHAQTSDYVCSISALSLYYEASQATDYSGNSSLGASAGVVYDINNARLQTTNLSTCEITSSVANALVTEYNNLDSTQKGYVDSSVVNTWTDATRTGTKDFTFSEVISRLKTIAGISPAVVVSSQTDKSSALLLGGLAAVAVLAAGAYFFVRKKKAD